MREEIVESIKKQPPSDFISHYLYDRVPFIFNDDRALYIAWKHQLGKSLEVDPSSIMIVGSAATGVSLNPEKNFKVFDTESDVDVAIISNYHFTVSWRYLRNNGHKRISLGQKSKIAWDDHVSRLIYWGTIATDKLLGLFPFGKEWLSAASKISQVQPTYGRDINFRIYSDYESLRSYQIQSVRRTRDNLLQ